MVASCCLAAKVCRRFLRGLVHRAPKASIDASGVPKAPLGARWPNDLKFVVYDIG